MAFPVPFLMILALLLPFIHSSPIEPVIRTNFMDPCIIQVNNIWYAFGGANGFPAGIHVQLASSTDFTSWTLHEHWDALPVLGSWAANPGHVWSPDVNQTPDGKFVMYYSATAEGHPGHHCIGAAVSDTIQGPYSPLKDHYPCDFQAGGAIDPDGFYDASSNTYNVIYKVDGNANGSGGACSNSFLPRTPTPFYLLTVSSQDLTTVIGDPTLVAEMSISDGPNIEGPTMYSHKDIYYLIYNDQCYSTTAYTIKYIVCKAAGALCLGGATSDDPHRTTEDGQKLLGTETSNGLLAPGSMDVAVDGVHTVFHGDLNVAWLENRTGHRVRGMYAVLLNYTGSGQGVSVDFSGVKAGAGAVLVSTASFGLASVLISTGSFVLASLLAMSHVML